MSKFYSAAVGGFYTSELHKTLPPDAKEIAYETWTALLDAQSRGLQIVAGPDGFPQAVERVVTVEQRSAWALAERDRLLAETDAHVHRHRDELDIGEGTTLAHAQYQQLLRYRQTLRSIDAHPQFPDVKLPAAPTITSP